MLRQSRWWCAAYRGLPAGNPINGRALPVFRPDAAPRRAALHRVASAAAMYRRVVGRRARWLTCLESRSGGGRAGERRRERRRDWPHRKSPHNYPARRLVSTAFGERDFAKARASFSNSVVLRVGRFPRKFSDESRISRSWHPSDAGRSDACSV